MDHEDLKSQRGKSPRENEVLPDRYFWYIVFLVSGLVIGAWFAHNLLAGSVCPYPGWS